MLNENLKGQQKDSTFVTKWNCVVNRFDQGSNITYKTFNNRLSLYVNHFIINKNYKKSLQNMLKRDEKTLKTKQIKKVLQVNQPKYQKFNQNVLIIRPLKKQTTHFSESKKQSPKINKIKKQNTLLVCKQKKLISLIVKNNKLFNITRKFKTQEEDKLIQIPKITIKHSKNKSFFISSKPLEDIYGDRKLLNRLVLNQQFLFRLNMVNGIYIPFLRNKVNKINVFIGKGNNRLLIKSLLKQRNVYNFVDQLSQRQDKINFIWTQIKCPSVFQAQQSSINWKVNIGQKSIQLNNCSLFSQQQNQFYNKNILPLVMKSLDMNKAFKSVQFKLLSKKFNLVEQKSKELIIHNHLQSNWQLGNKKSLFKNLSQYCQLTKKNVFSIVPRTYHIKNGVEDPQLQKLEKYMKGKTFSLWIIKPGQNSNRGKGINLAHSLRQVKRFLKVQNHPNGQPKTYIVQEYISNLSLINGRKYDLRHFMLLTSVNGKIRAYWSKSGYVRTTSYQFDMDDLDKGIHLTNDAIQKQTQNYGLFQEGNKLSYKNLERIIGGKTNMTNLLFKMKEIALITIKATALRLDAKKRHHNFQIFGLDFIVDKNLKPWLIQVNTNPCLQLCCPLIERVIPTMLEHAFRIILDPLFPPKAPYRDSAKGFELIWQQSEQGDFLLPPKMYQQRQPQEQTTYSNEGEQIEGSIDEQF